MGPRAVGYDTAMDEVAAAERGCQSGGGLFVAGGERFAFYQSSVRSVVGHYELRDTATGRVLDAFDHAEGAPIRDAQQRGWVAEVDNDH
jgi:hypothetical protein